MADLLKPWWKKNNDRGRLTILPESQTSLEEGGVTSRSCSNVNLKKKKGGGVEVEFRLDLDIKFYPKKNLNRGLFDYNVQGSGGPHFKIPHLCKTQCLGLHRIYFPCHAMQGQHIIPQWTKKMNMCWQKVVEVDRKMCWSADWLRSWRRRREVEKS